MSMPTWQEMAAGRPSSRLTDAAPLADEDAWLTDRGPQTVAGR